MVFHKRRAPAPARAPSRAAVADFFRMPSSVEDAQPKSSSFDRRCCDAGLLAQPMAGGSRAPGSPKTPPTTASWGPSTPLSRGTQKSVEEQEPSPEPDGISNHQRLMEKYSLGADSVKVENPEEAAQIFLENVERFAKDSGF